MVERYTPTPTGSKKKTSNVQAHRPLTGKERAYIAHRIKNPTATKADAIKAVYNVKETTTNKTMRNMATAIERRPSVLAILTDHAERAESMLVELAEHTTEYAKTGTKEGALYAGVAERTLNSMLDRVHGKAKQSVEVQSTQLNITIDMSSDSVSVE